jgi:hypothetical protein
MNPIILNNTELNITLTPTISTSIYVSGNVLFAPVLVNVLDAVALSKKLRFRVRNLTAIDMGGQAAAFDLCFFTANPASFGALNAACALNVADAAASLRKVVQVVTYTTIVAPNTQAAPVLDPFVMTLPTGQKFIYLAAIVRATPTYPAATNLKLILGLEIINDVHA